MRIFPRDPVSIGLLLVIADAAPIFIAMNLAFRRSILGQPPIDMEWWVSLGFRPPLMFFPLVGWPLIIFGIARKVRRRRRNVA
jgi:hypothetical protein